MNKLKLVYSSAVAAIFSIVFVTVITVWADLDPGLKNSLKGMTGHHWTAKSYLNILLYFGMMAFIYRATMEPTAERLRKSLYLVLAAALIGYAVLLVFYLTHYF